MASLFSEYDTYYIPYSLLETEQLERYFEQKAEKGYLIKKYAYGRQNGKFQPIAPAKYHFSIGIYDKKVTDEEENTERYEEFRKKWEQYGWRYDTSIYNLIIFYSDQVERPPVPDTDSHAGGQEDKMKVTVKEENRTLLRMSVVNFLCLIPYLLLFFVGPFRYKYYGGGSELVTGLFFTFLMFWTWETPGLVILLRQRAALRIKKETGRIPNRVQFWEEAALNSTGYLAVAVLVLIFGSIQLSKKMVILSALAILSAGLLLLLLCIEYRNKKNRYGGYKRFAAIIPLILLVFAVMLYPHRFNYRFQTSDSRSYSGRTEVERQTADVGMKPENLGWGKTDYSFYTDTSNLACEWERITYQNEMSGYFGNYNRGYVESLKYIGTLTAKLRKEKYLRRYLAQKELSVDGGILLDTDTEMRYYLTQTGKEIIGTKENDVVIYFLNHYDERSFDPEDKRLIEEIKRLDRPILQ